MIVCGVRVFVMFVCTPVHTGHHANSQVIVWFWRVVEGYSVEQKLKLLQFVTGTSSVPFEGFRALRGSNAVQPFTIDMLDRNGHQAPLPMYAAGYSLVSV